MKPWPHLWPSLALRRLSKTCWFFIKENGPHPLLNNFHTNLPPLMSHYNNIMNTQSPTYCVFSSLSTAHMPSTSFPKSPSTYPFWTFLSHFYFPNWYLRGVLSQLPSVHLSIEAKTFWRGERHRNGSYFLTTPDPPSDTKKGNESRRFIRVSFYWHSTQMVSGRTMKNSIRLENLLYVSYFILVHMFL